MKKIIVTLMVAAMVCLGYSEDKDQVYRMESKNTITFDGDYITIITVIQKDKWTGLEYMYNIILRKGDYATATTSIVQLNKK